MSMPTPFFDRQSRTPKNQRERLSEYLRGARGNDLTGRGIAPNVAPASKNVVPTKRLQNPDAFVAPIPDPSMVAMMQRRTRLL